MHQKQFYPVTLLAGTGPALKYSSMCNNDWKNCLWEESKPCIWGKNYKYKKYKLLHSIIYWTLQRIQLCIIYCRYDFTICKVLNMNIQTKTTARNNVKNVSLELFTLILRSCSTKNITGHLQICSEPMTDSLLQKLDLVCSMLQT